MKFTFFATRILPMGRSPRDGHLHSGTVYNPDGGLAQFSYQSSPERCAIVSHQWTVKSFRARDLLQRESLRLGRFRTCGTLDLRRVDGRSNLANRLSIEGRL